MTCKKIPKKLFYELIGLGLLVENNNGSFMLNEKSNYQNFKSNLKKHINKFNNFIWNLF